MLTRRERILGLLAAAVAIVFVLYQYVVVPWTESRHRLTIEQQRLTGELQASQRLFRVHEELTRRWQKMTASGLQDDPADAERSMLRAVRSWSQRSGLDVVSIKPERSVERDELCEIVFLATATGTMKAIVAFLYELESSPFPVRIRQLQMGTTRQESEDLSLSLRLSTLCLSEKSRSQRRQTSAVTRGNTP